MARHDGGTGDDPVHWRRVRRYLNGHRYELTQAAARLYPGLDRVGPTTLLRRVAWHLPEPVSLADVRLIWDPQAPPPLISGTEPQSHGVRPAAPGGQRFAAYTEALAELDPPRLLENRTCYRLTSVIFDSAASAMTFSRGSYFDWVNVGEAAAHELAACHMRGQTRPRLSDLPLRTLVGDPTDPGRRTVNNAITMLTLRMGRDGHATFLLHDRDPTRVTHAGGLFQVLPAGMFQPASESPAALRNDFDLWRCAVREYSEELLGHPERYGTDGHGTDGHGTGSTGTGSHDGTCTGTGSHDGACTGTGGHAGTGAGDGGAAFDYDAWPLYRALSAARSEGALRCHLLGLGVDPLSFAADLLAVCVIEAEVFDAIFAEIVASNTEGLIVGHDTRGLPFTGPTVERLVHHEPMQAAGAAVLALAWQHRERLRAI